MPSLAVKLNPLATCLHSGGTRVSILRFALMSAGIGLSIPILQWCFGAQTFAHFWLQWGLSIFYAASIGLLLWASMPYVWMRSLGWSVWLRWIVRAAVIVSACTSGCLIG